MERHEEMLSPEEQYAQLAPTLDADGFSLYAAAEEVTGLKVYEEFPYEDNHGMFEMADGHTLLRYLEAAYFGVVTWEIVPGTPYERAILGEVDKTSPEYRAFYQKICAGAAAHIKKRIGKERQNVKGPITEINKESFWDLIHEAKNACGQDMDAMLANLKDRLVSMGPTQAQNFHDIIHAYEDLADKFGLWDAAGIMKEYGCSDDGFIDFRAWLIAQGREVYFAALADPDSLADVVPYEAIYEPGKEERYYHDATKIDPADLPDFDLLCGGFPCQTFSIAGRRKGFDDTRGTLFFEIARLAQSKRPSYLLLENVPGLLSHDKGRTFSVILATLNDLGYRVEWMVLNSKHFGVPQSRRRLFLICYLDPRCAGKIFPVFGTGGKALIQVLGGSQGSRVYDADGIACTQTAGAGGVGGKTGLYIIPQDKPFVDLCAGEARQTEAARCLTARYGQTTLSNHRAERSGVLLIKEATKKGYKEANPGDSVDLGFSGSNTRRGRVGQDIAHTLETSCIQGIVERGGRIRRLMPRECLRLQGFDEWQIDRILAIQSDAQAYKQAGNSVTANVIEAIGRRIREVDAELKAGAAA